MICLKTGMFNGHVSACHGFFQELCAQPSNGPGVDYLSTPALKQALVDSSGPWVGGNFYGHLAEKMVVQCHQKLYLDLSLVYLSWFDVMLR